MLATFLCINTFAQLENTKWKTTLQMDGPVKTIMDFVKDANGKVVKIISHEAKDYVLTKIK